MDRILLFSLLFMALAMSSADLLVNPDFESPPSNVTANSSSPILLIKGANTIPGWSFNGTVWYMTSNSSFQSSGNAMRLGGGGTISQRFKANGQYLDYDLTFTLTAESWDCFDNSTSVNVSVPRMSKIFSLQRNFGRKMSENHAFYLGGAGEGDSIDLEIKSLTTMDPQQPNATCWPVVDSFLLKGNGMPMWYSGNMLANGGFEVGPAFLKNSSEGVLVDEEPDMLRSALQQWAIIGRVKYIDSKHYKVPKGRAAVELISGAPSGISFEIGFLKRSMYTLEFIIGDANDSCYGDFVVGVQVGSNIQNFTMQSRGIGTFQNYSLAFKVQQLFPIRTAISFASFDRRQNRDQVLCGPVIDNVILRPSSGFRIQLYIYLVFLIFNLLVLLLA